MKQVFLVLGILCCAFVDAQSIVSGIVTNEKNKTLVPNCYIVLKGSDGSLIQTKTDSLGAYKLELKANTSYEIYCSTDKTTTTPSAKFGFLASDDHEKFETNDSIKSYKKDFELTPVTSCGYNILAVNYSYNATDYTTQYGMVNEFTDSSYYETREIINEIYLMLLNEPSMVIQLSGHCATNEKEPKKLSLLRAEKLRKDLVTLGINEKRISCLGYGIEKLKIQNKYIKKAKTKEEKEALHAVNRRCVFRIISYDFDDGTPKKTEIPTYKPPIQKEGEQENLLPVKPK
jgi:hypothetical protein